MRSWIKTIGILFIGMVACLTIACEKETTCKALIIVKDFSGSTIDGVSVKLWVPNGSLSDPSQPTIIWPEQLTNNYGEANFVLANEAVMEIEAIKGALYGTSFIVLKQGVNIQQEIVIN